MSGRYYLCRHIFQAHPPLSSLLYYQKYALKLCPKISHKIDPMKTNKLWNKSSEHTNGEFKIFETFYTIHQIETSELLIPLYM